ncbi:RND efflux system, outer membrane lipoprotein, NodT family [Thiomonas sp. X19]|uniref:efflux transporter outer membrane subunit n=1 Tax=Thiomonas sp. X19 TaxID=1050370 RepID=UPI000B6B8224|nr:efflux transporter outer membrane subunit [Thiomonas sp. X19]SCC91443.1 RND efflux system, outer membrane lipoprotein, NodT family [Thiomonas sp. X19]
MPLPSPFRTRALHGHTAHGGLLRLAPLLAALLLAGCASTGRIQPMAQAVQPAQLGLSNSAVNPAEFPKEDWWTQFNAPELNRLIAQALADNPSLQEAQARMRQAQAAVGVAQSGLEPSLNAAVNSTRQRFSANDIYPPPLGGGTYTENQALLQGSYTFDFFGRNQDQLQAAIGQARAAQAQAQAARVLLAANVAGGYVSLARLDAQREVLERTLAQRRHIERLVGDRVRAGLETSLQQRQAQAEIPQIKLQLEQNAQARAQARHALAALLGQGPEATAKLKPSLQTLPMPALPQSLPAELIGRRADVVAARWQAQAALAGVKAARAAFYPNISLTAFAGLTALGFSQFLAAGSRAYGVGPALTLPIFEGGKLRANLRGQSAAADAAIAQYNATVVNAVREVADAVSDRRSLQQQIVQQQDALQLAQDAERLAQQRYKAGLGNYLNVLTTENGVLQLEQIGTSLKAQALVDDLALIRALGGGYATTKLPALPGATAEVASAAASPQTPTTPAAPATPSTAARP